MTVFIAFSLGDWAGQLRSLGFFGLGYFKPGSGCTSYLSR